MAEKHPSPWPRRVVIIGVAWAMAALEIWKFGDTIPFFDWSNFLAAQEDEATVKRLRHHRRAGRPQGGGLAFLRRLGLALVPGKPGEK